MVKSLYEPNFQGYNQDVEDHYQMCLELEELMANPPEIITEALNILRSGDMSGIAWVWHICATQEERNEVDQYLVKINHPLAQQAGTPELRFNRYVMELYKRDS